MTNYKEETFYSSFLCEIDSNFYNDKFNYQGLDEILRIRSIDNNLMNSIILLRKNVQEKWSRRRANYIYGILHSRFILTLSGAQRIYKKVKENVFGSCSTLGCLRSLIVQLGFTKILNKARSTSFCLSCKKHQLPDEKFELDGAFFGSDYIFYLLSVYPELIQVNTKNILRFSCYGFRFCNYLESQKKKLQKEEIGVQSFKLRYSLAPIICKRINWIKKSD